MTLLPSTPSFTFTTDSSDLGQKANLPDSSNATLCSQAPRCRNRAACKGEHSFSGDRGSQSTVEQPRRRETEVEVEQPKGQRELGGSKCVSEEVLPLRRFPPRIKMRARKRKSPVRPPADGEIIYLSSDPEEDSS